MRALGGTDASIGPGEGTTVSIVCGGANGEDVSARILLADDEPDILESVVRPTQSTVSRWSAVEDGEAALAGAARDGMTCDSGRDDAEPPAEVCRDLRGESNVPIIMLTAKDAEVDRVLGLELGADDYVPKPFSMAELASRPCVLRGDVSSTVRRREPVRSSSSAACEIDLSRHQVSAAARRSRLTPSEFKVLALFAAEPGRVFSREQIMEHLWETPFVGTASRDVHISQLRKKSKTTPPTQRGS